MKKTNVKLLILVRSNETKLVTVRNLDQSVFRRFTVVGFVLVIIKKKIYPKYILKNDDKKTLNKSHRANLFLSSVLNF